MDKNNLISHKFLQINIYVTKWVHLKQRINTHKPSLKKQSLHLSYFKLLLYIPFFKAFFNALHRYNFMNFLNFIPTTA
jgi:hypothetical protein